MYTDFLEFVVGKFNICSIFLSGSYRLKKNEIYSVYVLKLNIYTIFSTNSWTGLHKNATSLRQN